MKSQMASTGGERIVRRAAAPVWKQIEEAIAGDIASGRFVSGDQLPTEKALAERFEVNRHTVRRAVAALVERGLVAVHQGRGMFIPHLPLDYAIGPTTRFTANVKEAARTPDRMLLGVEKSRADDRTAKALDIRRGTLVVSRSSVGLADQQPITLGTTSFAAARLPGIEAALAEENSITEALRLVGVTNYTRQSTRIFATMPTPDEAELLRQSTRRPVLVTEAIDADASGTPISFGVSLFAGERVQLTV